MVHKLFLTTVHWFGIGKWGVIAEVGEICIDKISNGP